jgi:hypothetical protein
MLGTPGAVAIPALPRIAPAAPDPVPQGRTAPGLRVLAAPDPLTPGMVIVLFPGVGEGGTVGVTGVVMVPGAAGMVGRAAPTGGIKIGPGIEPALAPPASAAVNTNSTMRGARMQRPFIMSEFLPINSEMVTRRSGSKFPVLACAANLMLPSDRPDRELA